MKKIHNEVRPLLGYLNCAISSLEKQKYVLKWKLEKKWNKKESIGYPIQLLPADINMEDEDEILKKFYNTEYIYENDQFEDRIEVRYSDEERKVIVLEGVPSGEFIYVKPNTYSLSRQRQALYKLKDNPHPSHLPLIKLFSSPDYTDWPDFNLVQELEWINDNFKSQSEVWTDSQKKFIQIAMSTPDFAILEGPPGSGKTTAICEIILQATQMGKRVLLVASTHVAVDNVLERVENNEKIIPVRIGKEKDISKEMEKHTLNRKKNTEREKLIKFLQNQKMRTESQEYLLRNLLQRSEKEGDYDGEKLIEDIILDSANLICGTTIGILQHPMIKESISPSPVFDLMILDEASKTTFQEFLVPALYAKRWIISGDIRQLSPFVELKEVEGNVKGLLKQEEWRNACTDTFLASETDGKKGMNIIVCTDYEDKSLIELYKTEAKSKNVNIHSLLSGFQDSENFLNLLGANIIIGTPQLIKKFEQYLPPDIHMIRGRPGNIHLFEYRSRAYFYNNNVEEAIPLDETKLWEKEISWRIKRIFEQRRSNDTRLSEKYYKEIEELLPSESKIIIEDNRNIDLISEINRIRRIAFPSIIELLQEGTKRFTDHTRGSALTDGLPPDVLARRHVLLDYQLRMHPEISDFPRNHIYVENDIPIGLKDPPNMAANRSWDYREYNHRCVWIPVVPLWEGGIYRNYREADVILSEFKKFYDFTLTHKRKDRRPWEVGALSFYGTQEELLSKKFQSFFKSNNFYHFGDESKSIKVQVCNVDRFQGHEADIIFLSIGRKRGVGFLDCINRLNVALTRARYQLVIIGNRNNFLKRNVPVLLKTLAESVPIHQIYRWRD